jgi:hypothetical protein
MMAKHGRNIDTREAGMARNYFTLVGKTFHFGEWEIIAGDYDRETVQFEREEGAGNDISYTETRIIKSGDSQAEIDAAVAKLATVYA